MVWLAVLGLISLAFIFAGCALALKRIRRHREEAEMRRTRAFAEMMKIAEKEKERKKNAEGLNNYELKIENKETVNSNQ